MSRVLIVANRLPVTVRVTETGVEAQRSAGGLATGLMRPHEQSDGLWIGWSGAPASLSAEQQARLDEELAAMRLVPVPLTDDQVTRFYEGFSNGVLWPLFHYLLEQIPLRVSDWDGYVEANEAFADVVAAHYRPGDLIWVHDYQLLLLPGLLRERLPGARIGFFLHIPFPSEELFRTLPSRDRLLAGMLGADLVGFHTPAYLRHFADLPHRHPGAFGRDRPGPASHAGGPARRVPHGDRRRELHRDRVRPGGGRRGPGDPR